MNTVTQLCFNSDGSHLQNSQLIIQKTRLSSSSYPPSLPPGCSLRLHPNFLNKSRPPNPPHRRFFTLAHNASLLPLAKAPADRQLDLQPISYQSPPPTGVPSHFACADVIQSRLPVGRKTQPSVAREQDSGPIPPLSTLTNATIPIMPCAAAAVKPGYFLLQMMWTPPAPPTASLTVSSQHAPGQDVHGPIREEQKVRLMSPGQCPPLEAENLEGQSSGSPSTLSPLSSCAGEEEENWTIMGVMSLSGGDKTGEEEKERREEGGAGGEGGEEEPGGEGEGEEEGQREDGGGERDEDGDKDKDEDQDRQGEEEDEEDFDDLTQDEDEEEVMSSASEESVLSVPELQVNRKPYLDNLL